DGRSMPRSPKASNRWRPRGAADLRARRHRNERDLPSVGEPGFRTQKRGTRWVPLFIPSFWRVGSASDDFAHVFGCRSLLTLNEVELHCLPLGERLESTAGDGAIVDKTVLVPTIWSDESEPLRVIEPFYFAGRTHCPAPEELSDATPC